MLEEHRLLGPRNATTFLHTTPLQSPAAGNFQQHNRWGQAAESRWKCRAPPVTTA